MSSFIWLREITVQCGWLADEVDFLWCLENTKWKYFRIGKFVLLIRSRKKD